jgi:hypothetical protein
MSSQSSAVTLQIIWPKTLHAIWHTLCLAFLLYVADRAGLEYRTRIKSGLP